MNSITNLIESSDEIEDFLKVTDSGFYDLLTHALKHHEGTNFKIMLTCFLLLQIQIDATIIQNIRDQLLHITFKDNKDEENNIFALLLSLNNEIIIK